MNNTWILLRGLGREAGHWGSFTEDFARAYPGDTVLALDLPGAGEHFESLSPMSIEGIFRFVRAEAVRRAGVKDKFSLVAMSLGGMVAQEWIRRKPDDLNRVVLINTSDARLSPTVDRLRWQIWPRFVRLLSRAHVRERERELIELLINREDARQAALPLWVKLAGEHPIGYRSFLNQLWAAARFEGLESRSPVPVLLVNGLGDRLVDPSCSTQLHETFGWPIERHPWAGHDLTWDDAAWVIEKIARFTGG